ncbi:hypothetical protein CDL60_05535 [Roseateles noduli]|nr:hypothetical protein CDL60_05535 [Roseateles noduli]
MPSFISSFIHTRKSDPPAKPVPDAGVTATQQGFLQTLLTKQAHRSTRRTFARRVDGAVRKAVEVIGKHVGTADPHSFASLRRDYDAWSVRPRTEAFDEGEARRLRRLATSYITRKSRSGRPDDVGRAKIHLASCYLLELEQRILADRRRRQQAIDAQFPDRHDDRPAKREEGREAHAQALRGLRRDIDLAEAADAEPAPPGALAPVGSDAVVRAIDDRDVYRFHPMPTRAQAGESGRGPQNAALMCALDARLKQCGVDLGVPEASAATLDGAVGVLVDGEGQWLEGHLGADVVDGSELRRAVLAQWLIGRPGAGWDQLRFDTRGQLRTSALPMDVTRPGEIAREGLRGVSPLFTHPRHAGETLPALHQPVDAALAERLVQLDLQALARSLQIDRARIDVAVARRAAQAGLPPPHFARTRGDAIDLMLEPLRALQTALKAGPHLPLAMVLADAAEALSLRHPRWAADGPGGAGHPAC